MSADILKYIELPSMLCILNAAAYKEQISDLIKAYPRLPVNLNPVPVFT